MLKNKLWIIKNEMKKNKVNIRKHSIIFFFLLSYIISWTFWIFSDLFNLNIFEIMGRFGPLISAIIIVGVVDGKTGFKNLFSKFFVKGVNAKWYFYSLFGPMFIILPAIYINQLITGIEPIYNDISEWYLIVIAFLYVLFLSVLGEEIGWRGFALPRLLKRFNVLTASLIVGVVWGMWHLPLFVIEGDFHQMIPLWLFILDNIVLSIIMTWIYINTKGSLLVAHLFHTASNVALGIFPILPLDANSDMRALYIAFIILVIVTIFVVFNNRKCFCSMSRS